MVRKKVIKGTKSRAKAKKSMRTKAKGKRVKSTRAKKRGKRISTIPKGYNTITPYLIISQAAEAIDFYKKVFNAKEALRMERADGRIGHAELTFGDTKIMLADEFPEMDARGPRAFGGSPVGIHIYIEDVDDVIEKALALGATLKRPVQNMFYGDRSGGIEDPFGHKWQISTHIEDVSKATLKKRAAEVFEKA